MSGRRLYKMKSKSSILIRRLEIISICKGGLFYGTKNVFEKETIYGNCRTGSFDFFINDEYCTCCYKPSVQNANQSKDNG